MKPLIAIALLLLLCASSNAQELETIEVDTVSFSPKKSIPFDRPFNLKIRSDERPISVFIVEHAGNRSWTETIHHFKRKQENFNKVRAKKKKDSIAYRLKEIPKANYRLIEEAGKKYLLIRFGAHPDRYVRKPDTTGGKMVYDNGGNDILQPRKGYTIILNRMTRESVAIYDSLAFGSVMGSELQRGALIEASLSKFGLIYFVPDSIQVDTIYKKHLVPMYTQISSEAGKIVDPGADLKGLAKSNGILELRKVLTVKDNLDMLSVLMDPKQLRIELGKIIALTDAESTNLLRGWVTLDNVGGKAETDKAKQLANLELLLHKMQQVKELADIAVSKSWLTFDGSWSNAGTPYLETVIKSLQGNIAAQKNIRDSYKKIEKEITEQGNFLDPQVITGSSHVYNLETRNKFQISPDFGYAVYGFQKGFTSFTPYLGFQVNFRAIDRDIPFSIFRGLNRYPNKKVWHYLSFMTGWSLTKIAEDNKRVDFFESGSLMTGIGLRISNAVRITGGNLWFYKLDPKPELKGKKLAIAPFIALSLDLSLKSLMNDITSLKPTK